MQAAAKKEKGALKEEMATVENELVLMREEAKVPSYALFCTALLYGATRCVVLRYAMLCAELAYAATECFELSE